MTLGSLMPSMHSSPCITGICSFCTDNHRKGWGENTSGLFPMPTEEGNPISLAALGAPSPSCACWPPRGRGYGPHSVVRHLRLREVIGLSNITQHRVAGPVCP